MEICKFLYENLWKGIEGVDFETTVSSEETNFPATNTQRRIPGRRWRSTGCVEDQSIIRNFYSEIAVQAFCIRGNNFSADAVIKIQGNSEDVWTDPPFSATLSPIDERVMAAYFDDPVTYQYWRLLISDATNPDGYIEVGPIFLGMSFTPLVNYKNGGSFTPEDLSVITKSTGGQRQVVIQDQPGLWQYVFRTSEKPAFENIRLAVGQSLPFWFCEDPGDPNAKTQYVIALSWKWDHVHMGVWNLTLTLAEEM